MGIEMTESLPDLAKRFLEPALARKPGWAAVLKSDNVERLCRAYLTQYEIVDQAEEVYTRMLVLRIAGKLWSQCPGGLLTEWKKLGKSLAVLEEPE